MASIPRSAKLVLLIGLGFVFAATLQVFTHIYLADVYYERSRDMVKQGRVELALEYINKALEKNSKEPNYFRGRALVYITLLAGANEESQTELKRLALADLQKAHALNPHNLVTIRNSIPLYYFIATRDVLAPGDPENVDASYLDVVGDFYATTGESYEKDAGVCLLLARYANKLGLSEEYTKNVARVKELRPDLLEWNAY